MSDFETFYASTQQRVLRALSAVTDDVQDAQDCAQEAYVRAAQAWDKVSRHDSPEAWVRRVAMNLAYDGHRRRRIRVLFLARQRADETLPGPDEGRSDIVRAVRSLPRAQQEVIVLHHLLDLSVEQVARELGRPENTVKTQLVRGRAALARMLPVHDEVTTHD